MAILENKMSVADAKAFAGKWHVTSRTIYAWKRAGVDFSDELSVCQHIVNSKHPSPESLKAALQAIANANPETILAKP